MKPEDRILAYLHANKSKVEYYTLDAVVTQVKMSVFYGMSPISDDEIRKIVSRWASIYAVGLLIKQSPSVTPTTTPGKTPPPSTSDLVDGVKKALKTINKGVTIGPDGSNFNLGVKGLTANLSKGSNSVSVGVSWTGTLKLQAQSGSFHFEGSVNETEWEMTLSYPQDTYIPDANNLPKVFTEGERALGKMVDATRSFNNLNDVKKVAAQIKPHVDAASGALDAVTGLLKAKRTGPSFGFKIGSPPGAPGQQGMPGGVQGSIVFTWVF